MDSPFKPFKLGRYNVLLPLGEGGMAEVLLAEQVGAAGFTRLCTIKRIKTNLVTDPEYLRMFVDEARILVNIQHPNVVQVLDLQQEGADLYMVLEYVTGGDLRHLLKALNNAGIFMPVPVACYVAWCALRGLVQAHGARGPSGASLELIHRDISPGNILLGRNGVVKLSDFGVAKAAGRLSQTTDGSVKGSLAYMAPEMLEQGRADQRADIFSAGVVLWEMLTCRRLFPGLQPTKLVAAILTKEIPVPSSIQPAVSPALDDLVMRALDRDPARRFQTARALEMALYALVKEHHPDDLETSLSTLVKEHVTVRSVEDIALLPRPSSGGAVLDAGGGVAHALGLDNALGVQGPPPLASAMDDFFVSGGAFSESDVPAQAAAPHDDFFLAPPPVAPAGLQGPAEDAGDDFFNLVVTAPKTAVPVLPLPPPPALASESDTDFSMLPRTPPAHDVLAQPLPAPGFSLDPGLAAPSFTAMGDMEVPPVTMPLGLPPPVEPPSWTPQAASGAAIGSDFSAVNSRVGQARLEAALPPDLATAQPFHGDAVPSMAASSALEDDFFSMGAPQPMDLDATLPPSPAWNQVVETAPPAARLTPAELPVTLPPLEEPGVTPHGNPAPAPAADPVAPLESSPPLAPPSATDAGFPASPAPAFAATLPGPTGAPGVPAAWHGLEAFSAPPTAPPPAESAPVPELTVPPGMFALRGVHGPLDVAVCNAHQLWEALQAITAQTAGTVRVSASGAPPLPLPRLAIHLQLDHLVPTPALPDPAPREVPLDTHGLRQAFARLLNNRATGMLMLRPETGSTVCVFVQGGMVQYVHHPGAQPCLPAFLVAPGSEAMQQMLTDVLTLDVGSLHALMGGGALLEAEVPSRMAAFIFQRVGVVFGSGRWFVSFVPHASVSYGLPPGTLPATSWG